MTRSSIRFDPAPRWPLKRWFTRACVAFGVAGFAVWWAVPAVEAGAPPVRPGGALWAGSTSPFAPLAPAASVAEPPGPRVADAPAAAPMPPGPNAGVPMPPPAAVDAGLPTAPAPATPPADAQAEDTEPQN